MSRKLIARNEPLLQLQNDGYDISIQNGYVVISQVPYVDPSCTVKRGCILAVMNGDTIQGQGPDHTVHFIGDLPHHANGRPMTALVIGSNVAITLGADTRMAHHFSAKPKPTDSYRDYYHKIEHYVEVLAIEARKLDPDAKARIYPVIPDDDEAVGPFRYIDTASPRAGITNFTSRLENERIGIIGLGGTGSYILDFVAKTPASEIHLFDADIFHQHNAFRAPGAPSLEKLEQQPSKVDYLAEIYSQMHTGIKPHKIYVSEGTIDQLAGLTFAFVCIDGSDTKQHIVAGLEALDISFIDVGMGLFPSEQGIAGTIRVSTSAQNSRDSLRNRVALSGGRQDDIYNSNIQVADLNALNAVLAVIKWKKLRGFYAQDELSLFTTYQIGGNLIVDEDLA